MHIIYCADYWDRKQPDTVYAAEAAMARSLGMTVSLINFEALTEGANAVRTVTPTTAGEVAIYRGWLLQPDAFAALYTALQERGITLINAPAAYRFAQELPEYYAALAGMTPRSIWVPLGDEMVDEAVRLAAATFGDHPILVKDYVKSRKHEWATACYMPSAADGSAVATVIHDFVRLQGTDITGGLVVREFVEFAPLTTHPQSGMPLVKEYRLFVLDGEPLSLFPYWEAGEYPAETPSLDPFLAVARQIPSRFFTMDIAQKVDGTWLIVELGDGQVAGLPDATDLAQFYEGIGHTKGQGAQGA